MNDHQLAASKYEKKTLCGTVSVLLLKVETFNNNRLFDFVVLDGKHCANIKN
jgi:hypothetical protein